MARPIRIEYPGAVYHVTARGNERRKTFRDDADRRQFLATLAQVVEEHGVRLHGFCLMPNHYHLLVETPRANLSRAMGWLQTTYAIRFNHRHRRSGHLFQGRFKAHVVEADNYSMELLRYVHLNPVRPRDKSAPVLGERRSVLADYQWSSHRAYLGRDQAPDWLCTEWLSFFGRTRKVGQRRYALFVEDAFDTVIASPWEGLRFGLALGGEAFVDRVHRLIEKKSGLDEVRWVMRMENTDAQQATAKTLGQRQGERSWQVWVRIILGGERRIDVARELGYKDGSAITQILKRLESVSQTDPATRSRMAALRTENEKQMSSIKS